MTLKAIFEEAIGREKICEREVDILLPNLRIAIEYDGAYYHKDKETADHAKKAVLREQGYEVIRLREAPLEIGDNDIQIHRSNSDLTKADLNNVFDIIAEIRPSRRKECTSYIEKSNWLADSEYRRILSYLPGPPEEESLKQLHPSLADEWSIQRNFPLRPEMFHPKSGRKVWWRCMNGHEWQATIYKRAGAGRGCPYCTNKKVGYGNSLGDRFPHLAKEWLGSANDGLSPYDVVPGSGKKVWWQCENGHIFKARIADRAGKGQQCAYCPGPGRNRKYVPPLDFDE